MAAPAVASESGGSSQRPQRDGGGEVKVPGLLERCRAYRQLPREQVYGRLRYRLKRLLFALPLYEATLPGATAVTPLLTPPDPWPGDAPHGSAFARGQLQLAGQTLDHPQPIWSPPEANDDWLKELHGFAWLRDLRAAGGDKARRQARELVADWLVSHHKWHPTVWDPLTLARRLSHWLGQYEFFAASADAGFRQQLLASATAQATQLSRSLPAGLRGADLICAIKGLVLAGACLPGAEAQLKQALRLLRRELPRQILSDGGHIERSPTRHLAVLRDLIDIKSVLHAADHEVPEALQTAIESMAPVLRMFQHGDGGLALFNGSSEEDGLKIDLVLQRASGRVRPRLSAPETGYQRLQAGRSLVLVDAGRPPQAGFDSRAHAGTLAFEMSVGRERLIVNCGAPGPDGGLATWRQALRVTAAHSTLVVADSNSSALADGALSAGPGLLRRPESVVCRREEGDGDVLLDLSHDGYRTGLGLTHHRRLYLGPAGDDLRGEDRLSPGGLNVGRAEASFAVHFHLHPAVQALLTGDGDAVLLRLAKGGGWRLRARGAEIALEDSIYLGGVTPRRCQQVVLRGRCVGGEALVKWLLQREAGPPQRKTRKA
jgi:uncharacterized heparinase superfamily protein